MELDRNGFPIPAGFDDGGARQSFKPMRGRFAITALILLFGLLLGLAIQNKDRILAAMSPLRQRNGIQAIAERIQRNLDTGNLDLALRDTDRLIRIMPGEKWPRNMRGLILGQKKQYRESVAEFSRILQIDPGDASALNNRAYNRALWREEIDEALVDIDRAIAIGGELATFIDTRAYLNYLRGRHEIALRDLDDILNGPRVGGELTDAGIGEIFFHRGLVHERMGNADKAERDYAKARELGFKSEDKPQPLPPSGKARQVPAQRTNVI